MVCFCFLCSSRLLKLGKLAEYFSPFYRFRCHYPLITYLKTTHLLFELPYTDSYRSDLRSVRPLTWKLELDFYFRFVKTVRHFRNGAKVGVLPRGVRGGVPFRGSPQLKVRLPMEMDFLKSKEIRLSNFKISRKFQQISEINMACFQLLPPGDILFPNSATR